ncbi:hypothetical protein [Flavobacterium sp.]|uniref:hypothetical protein n=1 Tax=Flavobacterium sp. TaxID=239 RepID=UPI00374FF8A2
MKNNIKLLSKFHLLTLTIVITNYISIYFLGYSIEFTIILIIKSLFYVSGMVLYFFYRKPFNELSFYFSIFVFGPLITIIGWLTLYIGMFLTMLYVIFFSPWGKIQEEGNHIIYRKTHGFMNLSNEYRITEKNTVFYEKIITDFKIEDENPLEIRLKTDNDKLRVEYKYEKYNSEDKNQLGDTIINVKRK